jgi:hypothetical protein
MQNKKQHIIPKCYLKSWCDPQCAPGHEPYVWVISKDGEQKKKRAPANTFTESEIYTVKLPDGTRDLTIEYSLASIETVFARMATKLIDNGRPLNLSDRAYLCTFAEAMLIRTN